LANLGYTLSDTTVGNILKGHGIEPAPDRQRQTTWQTFLHAHGEVLAAIDFTTIEVWTKNGLVTFYLLFGMELATRRVHFAGSTTGPDEGWMKQIARNLTDVEEGFLKGKRFVLMDRDAKFCEAFRNRLHDAGCEPVQLPPRSPNLNAHLERFMRSLKEECLGRMIFFGEESLRQAIRQFLGHYHQERNHQGLGNRLIDAGAEVVSALGASCAITADPPPSANRSARACLGATGPARAQIAGRPPDLAKPSLLTASRDRCFRPNEAHTPHSSPNLAYRLPSVEFVDRTAS
jgi:transposase InsO family protein